MEKIDKKTSNQIYVIKAIAIVCSIAAHMPCEGVVGKILSAFGIIGVPCFLFCSGLLSERSKQYRGMRFIKKCGITWIMGGTLIWCICHIRAYNSLSWLDFILGNGSYLYYFIIMICILVIVDLMPEKSAWILLVAGVLRYISFHIEVCSLINQNMYLAFTFWGLYYALGCFASKKWGKIVELCANNWLYIGILWVVVSWAYIRWGNIYYFDWVAFPYFLVTFAVINIIANRLSDSKILVFIGKNTLGIYVWHMLIAGFLAGKLPKVWGYHLVSPVLALLVTNLALELAFWGLSLIGFKKNTIKLLIGYQKYGIK